MNPARMTQFHAAVRDFAAPVPVWMRSPAMAERFSVHRGNCRHSLCEALAAAYPAVKAGLGEAYFIALAAEFSVHSPPRSPVLHEFGAGFGRFLDTFPPLADWPWLGDVARIDWARREAYHAADADALDAAHLQSLPLMDLMESPITLHPSLRLCVSEHPAWSLWHSLQDRPGGEPAPVPAPAQHTQVWRSGDHVRLRLIDVGRARLLDSLLLGSSLGDALQDAFAATPAFDAAAAVSGLIDDGLPVAVDQPCRRGVDA